MFIDHISMVLIAALFFVPLIIEQADTLVTHNHEFFLSMRNPFTYFSFFGISLYFNKDCINGRSIGKRLLKLQVVAYSTERPAGPLKCFIRNIFCVIWPIEIIVTLTNPMRRLGDLLAQTKITWYREEDVIKTKTNWTQLLVSLVLSYGLVLGLFMGANSIYYSTAVKYEKSSYNYSESKKLEEHIAKEFSNFLVPSVEIFDKIRESDQKYISLVLKLKSNYLEPGSTFNALNSRMISLMNSNFRPGSFICQIKYIYVSEGNIRVRSLLHK